MVELCDVTLREGEQTPGAVFDLQDKLELAGRLDNLGIAQIQVSFPGLDARRLDEAKAVCSLLLRCKTEVMTKGMAEDWRERIAAACACGPDIVHSMVDARAACVSAAARRKALAHVKEICDEVHAAGKLCNISFIGAFDADREGLIGLIRGIVCCADRLRVADSYGIATPEDVYYSEFPNVKVIFSEAHSDKLAHLVLKGSLDMFVGVQYAYFPRLEYESLLDEKLYLTINGGKLREIFGNGFPEILKQFSEGVDVAQFLHQPFAMNLAGSVFRGGMDDFLNREGVKLHTVFENGDQELQLELCRRGMTISFCTQMHLYMARRLNEAALPDERIYVFPVNRMTMCNRLYLIRHRDAYFPPHKERMRQIACEVVRQFQLLDSDDFMEFELQ